MKKLALTIVCALATTGAAFAQGINFNPNGNVTVQTNTSISALFGGSGTGGVAGNTAGSATATFDYILLYQAYNGTLATDQNVWDGTWLASSVTATNSSNVAKIVASAADATVPWSAGTTDSIVLVGWSASLGSSWGVVSNLLKQVAANPNGNTTAGFFGESTFGFITSTASPAPGATVFGAQTANGTPIAGLLTQLYALPVPEPGTMALAGLSGLALVLFRRRK